MAAFTKDGVTRHVSTPAQAVSLQFQGWVPESEADAAPAESQHPSPTPGLPVGAPADLGVPAPDVEEPPV